MQSEKKFFEFPENRRLSSSYIIDYVESFKNYFRAYRFDNTDTAKNYILGLLKCTKGEANMERMEEEIDGKEYQVYQHFISNSNWDCEGLQKEVACRSSELLASHKRKKAAHRIYYR